MKVLFAKLVPMKMKNGLLMVMLAAGWSCQKAEQSPAVPAQLRLVRAGNDWIAVELQNSGGNVAALQLELFADGVEFLEAAAMPELSLDTVRMQMQGAGRAKLFVADKRGLRLPGQGAVARFRVLKNGTQSSELGIASAVVSDVNGEAILMQMGAKLLLQ